MKTTQLTESLQRLFQAEDQRLVFWYDADKEFESSLESLDLSDVGIMRLDEIGALELKIRLELESPGGKYLIYAPFSEPEQEDDWLLDLKLYSKTFHADRSSILLNELGLVKQSLRGHISIRQGFFRSLDRITRLKKWVLPDDTDRDLDLKMLAVVVRADQPQVSSILLRLFAALCEEDQCDLQRVPRLWSEIEKFGLDEPFWQFMEQSFGYTQKNQKLADLLIRLFVTDLSLSLHGECPAPLAHFLLSDTKLAGAASVFLSTWRGSVGFFEHYDLLSSLVAKELRIAETLGAYSEAALQDVQTCEEVEMAIARRLRDRLSSGEYDFAAVGKMLQVRRDGHWLRSSSVHRRADYGQVYAAIEAAANLLELRRQHAEGLSFPSAEAMFSAYTGELFQFDQLYRQFMDAADQVEMQGGDLLKKLRESIESCYAWFVDQVAMTWGRFVEPAEGEGLLKHWALERIPSQQDFYLTFVEKLLKEAAQSKVFVVISDALRFEAAEELNRELNGKNRFHAVLGTQLGVLPSYTGLGMAALLPHKALSFKDGASLEILVDGLPAASLEQRGKILAAVQGKAIKAENLTAMSRDEGREFVRDARVVYIYHDAIDAIGDKAATESKTFSAVRGAIGELFALVSHIINNLNGSQVLVTADHGFLFQETAPGAAEKSGLEQKPNGTLKAKKRYLLGNNLGKDTRVWAGDTKVTAGTVTAMEFWIPRGANLFHFAGGARFNHGGAMLQEVMVPVISVRSLRGKAAEAASVKKVDITPLMSTNKVVNNLQIFKFIQTEAVSDRVKPRTLLVSLRDGDQPISNEVALTFDSTSSELAALTKSARLTVQPGTYDKTRTYFLVLRDEELQIEYQRTAVTIDLAFSNDF